MRKKWPLMGESITLSDRLKMAYFCLTAKRFTYGNNLKAFESEWNYWIAQDKKVNSLYVSSGSTANFLLVAAVMEKYEIKPGDKIILPACTWMTNVSPPIQLGLTPVFCDVNLQNYSFDLDEMKLLARKHKDVKLIFVTHLLGFSANIEKIQEIFPKAIIIEDICESHGCLDNNDEKRGANSLGATFSFYFGHHMSTIEGGMVTTNNEELYDLMRMKRSHGLARESIYFNNYKETYKDIDSQFLFITDGYNFRNHEIPAVLGRSQLKRLDSMIQIRRRNYALYCSILERYPNLFLPHAYEYTNSSFCFPFICKTSEIRDKIRTLLTDNNIEHRPIVAGNLLSQPFLKGHKIDTEREIANAEIIHRQGIYVGNNHFVTEEDMEFLGELFSKV